MAANDVCSAAFGLERLQMTFAWLQMTFAVVIFVFNFCN
jgi:hypothetical protein